MHFRPLWLLLGSAYIIIILVVSLIRVPDINQVFSHTDKVLHFVSYFVLVGWFVQLYSALSRRVLILLGALSLGMTIELLQQMTAYRSFDFIDQLANSLGACCAYLLARPPFDSLLTRFDGSLHHWLHP